MSSQRSIGLRRTEEVSVYPTFLSPAELQWNTRYETIKHLEPRISGLSLLNRINGPNYTLNLMNHLPVTLPTFCLYMNKVETEMS